VCDNDLEVMMEDADGLIVDGIRDECLNPRVLDRALDVALEDMERSLSSRDGRREELTTALARLEGEIRRLSAAVATGGELAGLLEALREREARRATLRAELEGLRGRSGSVPDARSLRRQLAKRVGDWERLLERNGPEARQVLAEVVDGRIEFRPGRREHDRVYEVSARLKPGAILEGICPSWVASPAGFEPAFRP
jgi:hypothetical protein